MMKIGCCTVVLILLLCANGLAQSLTSQGLARDIRRDMEDLCLVSAPDSERIIQKYARAADQLRLPLRQLMQTKGCAALDELLLAGILRMDLDWRPSGQRCLSGPQQSLAAFYAFRTHPSASNKQAVITCIEQLHAKPDCGYEILFLPFLENVDESLRLHALLSEVSDGAMGEMLAWAVEYLAYTHRTDKAVFQRIEEAAREHHVIDWNWKDIP